MPSRSLLTAIVSAKQPVRLKANIKISFWQVVYKIFLEIMLHSRYHKLIKEITRRGSGL